MSRRISTLVIVFLLLLIQPFSKVSADADTESRQNQVILVPFGYNYLTPEDSFIRSLGLSWAIINPKPDPFYACNVRVYDNLNNLIYGRDRFRIFSEQIQTLRIIEGNDLAPYIGKLLTTTIQCWYESNPTRIISSNTLKVGIPKLRLSNNNFLHTHLSFMGASLGINLDDPRDRFTHHAELKSNLGLDGRVINCSYSLDQINYRNFNTEDMSPSKLQKRFVYFSPQLSDKSERVYIKCTDSSINYTEYSYLDLIIQQ